MTGGTKRVERNVRTELTEGRNKKRDEGKKKEEKEESKERRNKNGEIAKGKGGRKIR